MARGTLSNSERTWLGLGLIVLGTILLSGVNLWSALPMFRSESLVRTILTFLTGATAVGMLGWGLVLVCAVRYSFHLDGEALVTWRKTFKGHEIFRIPIADIEGVVREDSKVLLRLKSGEVMTCKGPFSEPSQQALSVVCSMLSHRDHAG